MITSKEARFLATGSDSKLRKECEEELEAAIKAAAALGQVKLKIYKQNNKLLIMCELARDAGFRATVISALDQRDTDYLAVEW